MLLNKLPPGVCWRGGGGAATGLLNEGGGGEQQASCLVAKQAVEFPQVYTSIVLIQNVYCTNTEYVLVIMCGKGREVLRLCHFT